MLRQALIAPKDPLKPNERCGVVNSVKGDTCDEEYVGETGRPLSTRMKEHQCSIRTLSQLWRSVLKIIGHKFDSDSMKIIDNENNEKIRKEVEAIHIRTH